MRTYNFQNHDFACATSSRYPSLCGGCGIRPAAGQSDRRPDQRNPARWLHGADVGLQLRHGRDRLDRDLRRVKSERGYPLVPGCDYSSHYGDRRPDDQSYE